MDAHQPHEPRPLPPAVNFHLNTSCNFRCQFCFARFEDAKIVLGGCMLSKDQQLEIIGQLPARGVDKLTFVGGEPTLVPWLNELIAAAKQAEMTTMIVTNGSRLTPDVLDSYARHLDWIAFSVDSADCSINLASGRAQRGQTLPAAEILRRAARARSLRLRIKLNTVVHSLNADEDMSAFVAELAPERWKIFQVLPIDGQNDGTVEDLLITEERFGHYVERHRHLEHRGIRVVPEHNDAMRGSYVMIDPAGRFFDNTKGSYTYSRPILDVGIDAAFREIEFSSEKFEGRGGTYEWGKDEQLRVLRVSGDGPGADA